VYEYARRVKTPKVLPCFLGTTRSWGFNYLIDQAAPPQQTGIMHFNPIISKQNTNTKGTGNNCNYNQNNNCPQNNNFWQNTNQNTNQKQQTVEPIDLDPSLRIQNMPSNNWQTNTNRGRYNNNYYQNNNRSNYYCTNQFREQTQAQKGDPEE